MEIDISFSLNTVEQDLLLQQIRKEFAQHVEEYNKHHERRHDLYIKHCTKCRNYEIACRKENEQGMKCSTLCDLAKCCDADWFVHKGKQYSFSVFKVTAEGKYLTTQNKKNKLVIHLMQRAGIITKEKMQEILKLRQYNGEARTFKALSHFRDEILKSFKIIQNRIKLEDLRKIMNGTESLLGCIRDVMERKKL
jgi:hypothetical protein